MVAIEQVQRLSFLSASWKVAVNAKPDVDEVEEVTAGPGDGGEAMGGTEPPEHGKSCWMGLTELPAETEMGTGSCWTLATPTQGVGKGAETECALAGLNLGARTGIRWTCASFTRGTGTGVKEALAALGAGADGAERSSRVFSLTVSV